MNYEGSKKSERNVERIVQDLKKLPDNLFQVAAEELQYFHLMAELEKKRADSLEVDKVLLQTTVRDLQQEIAGLQWLRR